MQPRRPKSLLPEMTQILATFIKSQSFSGALLLVCTAIALWWANSSKAAEYFAINHIEIGFQWGIVHLEKSLQHWVNDGLMAIFFLLVGLEIKRELLVGELSSLGKALLPIAAALGGMIVPALLYVAFNYHAPEQLLGWAIPSATDIAFAMGILSLMGSRVPRALFVFLSAIAIADDLGAILIIAVFYNQTLNWIYFLLSAGIFLVLLTLNYCGVKALRWYGLLGIILWFCVMQSGIHATIAGVLLALTIPGKIKDNVGLTPLCRLEQYLHFPVTYVIIPLFVLFNAGVALTDVDIQAALFSSVTVGIVLGLVVGKCAGIFGMTALFVKCKWVRLSEGVRLVHFLPVSLVAGIGFTMSIFIAELAFPGKPVLLVDAKLGILCASVIAGMLGYATMYIITRRKHGSN